MSSSLLWTMAISTSHSFWGWPWEDQSPWEQSRGIASSSLPFPLGEFGNHYKFTSASQSLPILEDSIETEAFPVPLVQFHRKAGIHITLKHWAKTTITARSALSAYSMVFTRISPYLLNSPLRLVLFLLSLHKYLNKGLVKQEVLLQSPSLLQWNRENFYSLHWKFRCKWVTLRIRS